MRVKRDFDDIYATQDDPWGIGDADSDRYNHYVERILAASHKRGTALELGCGYGALLARLNGHFDRLIGVELSGLAVKRGEQRFPFIEFSQGSLADPGSALPGATSFDTIVVSDVLYYLTEHDRQAALAWIADHLAPGGLAFLAGWSPGGDYLTPEEFRNLAERELAIESEELLETEHAVFCCRPRRTLAALTVDYETWQPQLEGLVLDWDTDVFKPTQRLLDLFDQAGATLTIFAEMGEYMWLSEHRPETAQRMEAQWREAVMRGHDVQLHLHPNWLPEMGPSEHNGQWEWDMERTRAADYPGDLTAAIARCKVALEDAIRPVSPDYEVVAYRAGTYEAQPFDRLYAALEQNGIWCDSSVVPGDSRPDRHYDYKYAYADHQPWFASRYDPQLKAPPAERGVVELPVFTPRWGTRWTFDNEQGSRFAELLLTRLHRERRRPSSEALRRHQQMRTLVGAAYVWLQPIRPIINRVMPRRLAHYMMGYERERLVANRYFVLVSHTKTALDFDAIASGLGELRAQGVELVSLSELAKAARTELEAGLSDSHEDEAARQVRREYAPQMSDERNVTQSEPLRRLIPLDSRRIIDVGCGRGVGTLALAQERPWARITGTDVGEEFIERARLEFGTDKLSFAVADFVDLPFADAEFDCVHADNSLEHAFDVDATLGELYRVLSDGGSLVAALPPDGLNADRTCDNHTWKTTPSDVRARLAAAGFVDVEMRTLDVFRELAAPPFPPSRDQMLYIRAWKRHGTTALDRIGELTRWAYTSLDPETPQKSNDPLEILAGGHAWCWGYVVVLGRALAEEGFDVRWVTMIAEDHPVGRGERRTDSHEVLEVILDEHHRVVCDPMAGVVFEASLAQLLADPSLADAPHPRDDRFTVRNYALYSTSQWYRLVRRVAIRRRPNQRLRYVDARSLSGAS